ncbi:DUF3048 domain-containing protein [Candidatus Microgenomates bacterium]|nr:DUF3048 domain-containing protein [Candidatus Microgenomates bacterium]
MRQLVTAQNVRISITLLGLYLLSAGVSWLIFFFVVKPSVPLISPIGLTGKRAGIDPNAPKTESCPLNGKKYTKQEREIWEQRRPLTVMIENHEEARPQSGLASADVVYEAVAEGGITRFLAVFYCGASAEELTIGPVRSARVYFMDWASEYGDKPLYVHVGGANRPGPADALGLIARYGWLSDGNDFNQFAIGFPTFWRDYERIGHPVATEHTMYSTTDKLWQVAQERDLEAKDKSGTKWDEEFLPWKFKEPGTTGTVSSISFPFWSGHEQYSVRWTYEGASGVWKRENGDRAHTDLNNNQQLTAANVVVLFTSERSLGDVEKHLLYQTTGSGKVLVFQAGTVIEGTWKKQERTSRTEVFDKTGKEISFVAGPIWIEVLSAGTEVNY